MTLTNLEEVVSEKPAFLKRCVQRSEKVLFSLLFDILGDNHIHPLLFYVGYVFVMILQLAIFLGNAYLPYNWDTSVSNVFLDIVNFVGESPFRNHESSLHLICAIVVLIYTFSLVSILLKKQLGWKYQFTALFHFIQFCTLPLLFPIYRVLLGVMFGCVSLKETDTSPFLTHIRCNQTQMIGWIVYSLILCILYSFIVLASYSCLFFATPCMNLNTTDSYTYRQQNRVEIFGVLVKLILILLFTCAGGKESFKVPMAYVSALLGTAMVAAHVYYQEFLHDVTMSLFIFKWCIITWGGYIKVYFTAIEDKNATSFLYFTGLPLLLIGSFIVVRWRFSNAISPNDRDLSTCNVYVLLVRAQLRAFVSVYSRWDAYVDDSEDIQTKRQQIFDQIDLVLHHGALRFPEDVRFLSFIATYYTSLHPNRVNAFRVINSLEALETFWDIRFRCYRYRQVMEDNDRNVRSAEVEHYIEFKEKKFAADKALAETSRWLVLFWTELLKVDPDISVITTIGHSARRQLHVSRSLYRRLLELNKNSIPTYRILAIMHLNITGETAKAMNYLSEIDRLERNMNELVLNNKLQDFTTHHQYALDIFDEMNGVVSMSVELDKFGEILDVNTSMRKIFGFTTVADMIGKNLGCIMPPELGDRHDDIMRVYLEKRKSSKIVDYTRLVWGQHHTTGYLIPVYLYVRWSGESTVVGVLKSAQVEPSTAYVMLDEVTGAIIYASREFFGLFGIGRRDVNARTVLLKDLFPSLENAETDIIEDMYMKTMTKRGFTCEGAHVVTLQKMLVELHGVVIETAVGDYHFVKITATQLQEEKVDTDSENEETVFTQKFSRILSVVEDDAQRATSQQNTTAFDLVSGRASVASVYHTLAPVDAGSNPGSPTQSSRGSLKILQLPLHFAQQNHPVSTLEGYNTRTSPVITSVFHQETDALAKRQQRRQTSRSRKILDDPLDMYSTEMESHRKMNESTIAQKRLKKAIELNNIRTSRSLKLMNIFLLTLTGLILATSIGIFIYVNSVTASMRKAYEIAFQSGLREKYFGDQITALESRIILEKYPLLLPYLYRPHIDASMNKAAIDLELHMRQKTNTESYNSLSLLVDHSDHGSKALQKYLNTAVERFETLQDQSANILYHLTPPRDATSTFGAMISHCIHLFGTADYRITENDICFYWITANTQSVRLMSRQITQLYIDELADNRDILLTVPLAASACITVIVIQLMWVLIRPIIVRIEISKTSVRNMFLDIPSRMRRTLRRKVHDVYKLLTKDDESSQQLNTGEEDNEDTQPSDFLGHIRQEQESNNDAMQRYMHSNGSNAQREPSELQEGQQINLLGLNTQMHKAFEEDVQAGEEDDLSGPVVREKMASKRFLYLFYTRFAVAMFVVLLYFVFTAVYSYVVLDTLVDYSRSIRQASRRLPSQHMAWYFSRLNLLYDYDIIKANNPVNPLLRAGHFYYSGKDMLHDGVAYYEGVVYGLYGLHKFEIAETDSLMYINGCGVSEAQYVEAGIALRPNQHSNCKNAADGALSHGAAVLWAAIVEKQSLTMGHQYTMIANHLVTGVMPSDPLKIATADMLMKHIRDIDEWLNYFLDPVFSYINTVFYQHSFRRFDDFTLVLIVALVIFLIFVSSAYIFLLYPQSGALMSDANKIRSLMLLLPMEIVTNLESVQNYINKQLQTDI